AVLVHGRQHPRQEARDAGLPWRAPDVLAEVQGIRRRRLRRFRPELRLSVPAGGYPAGGSAGVRLCAGSIVQLGNLRREGFAEVGGLEHRADLDLARARHGVGATLYPLDGLGHVLDLPEPETGDELLRLGRGAIDDRA